MTYSDLVRHGFNCPTPCRLEEAKGSLKYGDSVNHDSSSKNNNTPTPPTIQSWQNQTTVYCCMFLMQLIFFKLAICMLYIKQSFNNIQINRDCNPQNDLVEKSFTLQVWLDALDVTAATLCPVFKH